MGMLYEDNPHICCGNWGATWAGQIKQSIKIVVVILPTTPELDYLELA